MSSNQPTRKPTSSSTAEYSSGPSLSPGPIVPEKQMESSAERSSAADANRSYCSASLEPFPEFVLDDESGFTDASPTFAHEVDTHAAPAALPLPGSVIKRTRQVEAAPVRRAHVAWVQGEERKEEEGEMREASGRALEWARKMFGEDVESDSKDSKGLEQIREEAE